MVVQALPAAALVGAGVKASPGVEVLVETEELLTSPGGSRPEPVGGAEVVL